jgi:hypothetical protein
MTASKRYHVRAMVPGAPARYASVTRIKFREYGLTEIPDT